MSRVLPPTLLALTPGLLCQGASLARDHSRLIQDAREAIGAGLRGIVLREPQLPDEPLAGIARELIALLNPLGGWLAVHDRPHLVNAVGAQAVHLGARSLTPSEARSCAGSDVCIGFSSHAGDGAAEYGGADYLFHSPVFAPLSKATRGASTGLTGLRSFCEDCDLPVWGLGGVTASQFPSILDAGAKGGACLGSILGRSNPAVAISESVRELVRVSRR